MGCDGSLWVFRWCVSYEFTLHFSSSFLPKSDCGTKSTMPMERSTHFARKICMFHFVVYRLWWSPNQSLHGCLRWFSAIIVPTGRDPQTDSELWEYWVARIKDIRAIVHDENSNTVRVSLPSVTRFALIWPPLGLGTCAMALLRQRCIRRHKILVRRQK